MLNVNQRMFFVFVDLFFLLSLSTYYELAPVTVPAWPWRMTTKNRKPPSVHPIYKNFVLIVASQARDS